MLKILGEDEELPNTYQRGRKLVDNNLCTKGINIRQADYLSFGEEVEDQRVFFLDVAF